jgi:hypothetical protein
MIDDPNTALCVDYYVRPNDRYKQGRKIVINRPGARFDYLVADTLRIERPKTPVTTDDPIPPLNHFLLKTMQLRDPMLPIPWEVVAGFANAGKGYWRAFHSPWWWLKGKALLTRPIAYPPYLVVGAGFEARWTRRPESEKEQLLHFLFHLRATCFYLAQYPLGKPSTMSQSEVAHRLSTLPNRTAYVQSGEHTARIQTLTAAEGVNAQELEHRFSIIREQTRAKYCQPVSQADNTPPPESDDEPPASRWEEDE